MSQRVGRFLTDGWVEVRVFRCRLASRPCHNLSSIRRLVPYPSQNRTASVTPPGPRLESSIEGLKEPPPIPHRSSDQDAKRTPTGAFDMVVLIEASLILRAEPKTCSRLFAFFIFPPSLCATGTRRGGSPQRLVARANKRFHRRPRLGRRMRSENWIAGYAVHPGAIRRSLPGWRNGLPGPVRPDSVLVCLMRAEVTRTCEDAGRP